MNKPDDRAMPDFTIVVLQDSYASGVTGAVDLLAAARDLARTAGAPIPSWRLASPQGGTVRLDIGFHVETEPLAPGDGPDRSTWIFPAITAACQAELAVRLAQDECRQVAALIRGHLDRGGAVAACASSVFLLQLADALANRRVTTAWWLADALEQAAPGACVDAQRPMCIDGPLTTCGPVFAQTDLMLDLVGRLCGPAVARQLSLLWLRSAQAAHPGADLLRQVEARDDMVARIVNAVEQRLPDTPSVADLASELAMSERTLSRHVRRVTGKSTHALVQDVRLRRARSLLERSRMSIDQIAAAVGYSDSTALRRLMKRMTGAQPSRYRAACLPA